MKVEDHIGMIGTCSECIQGDMNNNKMEITKQIPQHIKMCCSILI